MKYSIIVPCYNEEQNIADLISLLEKSDSPYEIQWVIVENGSLDGTRKALEFACEGKKQFTIAYVDVNQGYGYGLQQGMKMCEGQYIGWLHADMQIEPSEMIKMIQNIEMTDEKRVFFKGKRRNRSFIDYFFTDCMSIYASIMLKTWIYDIGAIPVLFHKDLLKEMPIMPYDFSIETYVYAIAKKSGFVIKRFDVKQQNRKKGKSSWNKGFSSKVRQSRIIMRDIAMIKRGVQVK